jgi:hypothetical protein
VPRSSSRRDLIDAATDGGQGGQGIGNPALCRALHRGEV